MKKAAFIVVILSLVMMPLFYFYFAGSYLKSLEAEPSITLTESFYKTFWVSYCISFAVVYSIGIMLAIFDMVALIKGRSRKTQIVLGVLSILFLTPVAGILILVIPERYFVEPGLTVNIQSQPNIVNAEEEPEEKSENPLGYTPTLKDFEGNQYVEENEDESSKTEEN